MPTPDDDREPGRVLWESYQSLPFAITTPEDFDPVPSWDELHPLYQDQWRLFAVSAGLTLLHEHVGVVASYLPDEWLTDDGSTDAAVQAWLAAVEHEAKQLRLAMRTRKNGPRALVVALLKTLGQWRSDDAD